MFLGNYRMVNGEIFILKSILIFVCAWVLYMYVKRRWFRLKLHSTIDVAPLEPLTLFIFLQSVADLGIF